MDMTKRLLDHNPLHQNLAKSIREQNDIRWGHALRGRFSKELGKVQEIVDKAEKRSPRPGIMVSLICILWEERTNMWKARKGVQNGVTKIRKKEQSK